MSTITDNVRLAIPKNFKAEVKQYSYTITASKKSKYISLADMKRQLFLEFSTYSDEELDFLHEYVKSKSIRADKTISSYLPVWAAIAISIFNAYFSQLISPVVPILSAVTFTVLLLISTNLSDDGIKRLNFCSMVLELIEKVEQQRGHTFNDSLAENKEISATIN